MNLSSLDSVVQLIQSNAHLTQSSKTKPSNQLNRKSFLNPLHFKLRSQCLQDYYLDREKSYVVRASQHNMQKSSCKKVTCKNICNLNQYETNSTEGEQPPFCLY